MILYNHVAGGTFPPKMPKGLNEQKFGNINVVIFALNRNDAHDMYSISLAEKLRDEINFRGLVYSYSPENEDYMKCFEFFEANVHPSYVVVSYRDFREHLCTDSNTFYFNNDYGDYRNDSLDYTVINGEILCNSSSLNVVDEVIRTSRLFYLEGVKIKNENIVQSFGSIPKYKIPRYSFDIENKVYLQENKTEITVLFNRPARCHTNFERFLYFEFVKYGSMTNDARVKILYPIYISDEYAITLEKYEIKKLPAVIYENTSKERLILKIERDFFEFIPNLTACLPFIISDIHRIIADSKIITAGNFVKEIQTTKYGKTLNLEEIKTSRGVLVTQLRPKENLEIFSAYSELVGNIKNIKIMLEKIDQKLSCISFDIFKIKLKSNNVVLNLEAMKTELEKLSEIEDLSSFFIEKMNPTQTDKLTSLNNDIIERLEEIRTLVDKKVLVNNLTDNEYTQQFYAELNELKPSKSDILLQRSSAIVSLIGFAIQILQYKPI